MTRIVFAAALALVVTLAAMPAQAGEPRTFVSAAGTDNSKCSFAKPCRHFQAAVNATSAGGEVDALNPADYGPITITQAITIEGQGWSYITPPANGNGITVNAVSGKVIIRGVSLNGVGMANAIGILFNSGSSLSVQNCVIENFISTGLLFQPTTSSKISVSNTRVSDNDYGIAIEPTGGGGGSTIGVLDHVHVEYNTHDGVMISTSSQNISATVNESMIANNGGAGITAPGYSTSVWVRNSTINYNGSVAFATGQDAAIFVTRSMIVRNGGAFTGNVESFGDNVLGNNGGQGDDLNKLTPIAYH